MYDLNELKEMFKIAQTNLTKIGIDMSNTIITIEIDGRLTRACANCSCPKINNNKRYSVIKFSPEYLENSNERDIWDTIYHELLHTLPNCFNHGKVWQEMASIVNREFGCNVQQYYKGTDYNPMRYQIRCDNCNRILYRVSKQTQLYKKIANGYKGCYCTNCGSHNLIALAK